MKLKTVLALLFAFGCLLSAFGQIGDIIPASRLYDWRPGATVGVPGGIPTRTVYTNMTGLDNTGNVDCTEALQAALNNCPSNQAVVVPAGTFKLSSYLYLTGWRTLKGAGMTNTVFKSTGGLVINSDSSYYTIYTEQVVTSGATKGSTNIVVPTPSAFTVGRLALIAQFSSTNQTNNPLLLGVGGTNNQYGYMYRVIARVVAKDATSITFWPPLYGAMSNHHARIKSASFLTGGVGVEDCTLLMSNTQVGIIYGGQDGSWIKNVKVRDANNYSVSIYESLNVEVRDCVLDDLNHGGSNGAGLLMNTVCGSLIENNAILNSFPGIEINAGSCGNVVGYNFLLNTNGLPEIDSNHGAHNSHNLFEGNIAGRFISDGYFGSESEGTVYRNWFHGIAPGYTSFGYVLSLKRFTRNYSLVGNIFGIGLSYGNSGYDGTGGGQPNMGNGDDNGLLAPPWADFGVWPGSGGFQEFDTGVTNTLVRKGNYNFFTDSIPAVEATAVTLPDSLYRTSKPAWFGDYPWPPFVASSVNTSMTYSNSTLWIPAQGVFLGLTNPPASPDPPVGVEVGIVTQTVNDAYFAWHGGTNRLAPPAPNGNLRGSYFQWHLDNPEGPQVLVYENEVHQAQFDEPAGFGSCNVARGWSVQSYASNIIVAIIDDSFDLGHPELQGRWWINPATGVPGIRISSGVESTNVNVSDAQLHGMQAAGIIGAIGNNTAGVAGVCKDGVQIMPIACAGSNADLGRGVLWAATNGAHIILFAYGWYQQETAWTNAFMVAQQRGCLVVNAVLENGGTANSRDIGGQWPTFTAFDYPCMWGRNLSTNIINISNLLAVTCSTMEEIRYSIGGWSTNFVDLLYPGRRIPTCLPPSSYTAHGGTSPAAAIVAGHAALLMERYRNESAMQIKERIMATVHVRTNYFTNSLSGGEGDVYASMIWQPTNRPPVLRGYR